MSPDAGARLRHGIYVPTFGEFDERALAELAAESEARGWDGLFVWDHVLWDPFETGVADTTVGGTVSLETVTETAADVWTLPAASRAVALSV